MFELWHQAASSKSAALGLIADRLYADHELIIGAMGHPWVQRETTEANKQNARLATIHPLYRDLTSGTDLNLVAVAELAMYLKGFKNDPKIGRGVANLREANKYRSTQFEMAMAYRWMLAGAAVQLEPEIPYGLADFAATVQGTTYIVECASFPNDVFSTEPNELAQFLMPFGSKNFTFPFSVVLEVRVTAQTPGDFYGDVSRACKAVLKTFKANPADARQNADFGEVRLRRSDIEAIDGRDWNSIGRLSLHEGNESGSLLDAHLTPEVGEKGVVCVAMPRSGDGYQQIRKKFINEYRQLREVTEPRVIILDISGLTYDVLRVNLNRINDGIGQDLLERPKVVELWLVTRGFSDRHRFQYHALMMNNRRAQQNLPVNFKEALNNLEHKTDYLTNLPWPL